MEYIPRFLEKNIEKDLFLGKVIVLYGARQVGKTTLVQELLRRHEGRYISCDGIEAQEKLSAQDARLLRAYLGPGKLFILDEAQRIKNIGLNLKILVDAYPDIQIIATGSSSFDLANSVNEPLTGRVFLHTLYPLSAQELRSMNPEHYSSWRGFSDILRFGAYPDVIFNTSETPKERLLQTITANYLYKDLFNFQEIRRPELLPKLLQLLALQIGSEVSYDELATRLSCSRNIVVRYIHLLEQAFVIFTLPALARNARNEIGKKTKIYFYDLGIRNALAQQFGEIDFRNDIGALWENFCIVERKKMLEYSQQYCNQFFWRTVAGGEIDYVEERNAAFAGYEFKWNENKSPKIPEAFLKYNNARVEIINRENFLTFVESSQKES